MKQMMTGKTIFIHPIFYKSVEGTQCIDDAFCVKDHARTPAGFAAWSMAALNTCLEEELR